MTADAAEYGQDVVVKVGGRALDDVLRPASVVVDRASSLPSVAVVGWYLQDPAVLRSLGVKLGAQVEVSTTVLGTSGSLVQLFTGTVTSLEYERDARGTHVNVRCMDDLHKLMRGRRTRTFLNTTDADVARKVLSGAGVSVGAVEMSSTVLPYVVQAELSDWEFLVGRCQALGREVAMDKGKAQVRPRPKASSAAAVVLDADALERLRVRVSSAGQVKEVVVAGWDPGQAKTVEGRATPAGTGARLGTTLSSVTRAFPSQVLHEGSPVLRTANEVTERAKALAARVSDAHAELEAVAPGDPRLLPGQTVKLEGALTELDGLYVLTRARHVVDQDGYRTFLECSGGEDRRLGGLTGGSGTDAVRRTGGRTVAGVTVGLVTDVDDPQKQGRVKLTLPWLDTEHASDWARVASPGAGGERGLALVPEVNDEVLVAFEHGDMSLPYVVGGLWSAKNKPPRAADLVKGGKVDTRALVSRAGHAVVLSDGQKPGVRLETSDRKLTVGLDGSTTTITVDSQGKVEITGGQAVTVTSKGKLSLEGKAGVEIKGAQITLQAQANVVVKGAVIQLN